MQAPAGIGGQLVDEAELAVVVTGHHPVEDRRVHLDTEGGARRLGHDHGGGEATAHQLQFGVGLVDEPAVLEDIGGHPAVDGDDLVTHPHPGELGW